MSEKHSEKMGFQTEVSQLLHLVTHSLYSHKEIFLRELISNASDAIDKLKFLALSDDSLYDGNGDLKVQIGFDADNNTVTISDNGIGMNREELIDNLGTIAKSGTKAFFSQLSGDKAKDSELIGQFGVGFYSAFIVADKVSVQSLRAGDKQAYQWQSDGQSDFTLSECDKSERGTSVTLHLKADEKEFTNRWTLQNIITKYSDHISIPVELWQDPVEEQKDEDGNVTVEAKAGKFEQINKAKALWTRPKNEVSDEEYQAFYKHISHDFQEAATWTHNKVEGKLEYTSLLFLPQKAPWDMFQRDSKHGLKLFVQRVFIMDEAEQFLPHYLRFIKGVIDSNDLPLNVSREILQDNAVTQSLKKACTKRSLTMLQALANDEDQSKYNAFWSEFGNAFKEGIGEDFANRETICKLLRFASTNDESLASQTALADYIERMKDGQEKIYYLVADSKNTAKNSPHLEIFEKNDVEVLLMWEPIDEWMMSQLHEFDGKSFESINQTDISGDLFKGSDSEEKSDDEKAKTDDLIEKIKSVLGDKVTEVRKSKRLTKTPSCVVLGEGGMTNQMYQIMKAAGQELPEQKYIFEVNTDHAMVKQLADMQDDTLADWVNMLYGQALLAENGSLEDSASFIATVNRLLS
ncbi:MAG: molecular chaperone HtpG [Gammaproteobacteria bacterium]|nr:MAG: molecular chaperone HtpG [Gammaproteobacteria bacterium]